MDDLSKILTNPESTDEAVLDAVAAAFRQSLVVSEKPRQWLEERNLLNEAALAELEVGYADGRLGKLVPHRNEPGGLVARDRLVRLGIYRETGKPHLLGALTLPVRNATGRIVAFFGRRFVAGSGPTVEKRPHSGDPHAFWNPSALDPAVHGGSLVVCARLVDALSCVVNGVTSVTWARDDEHLATLAPVLHRHGVSRLLFPKCGNGDDLKFPDDEAIESELVRVPYGKGLWHYLKRSDYPQAAVKELLDLRLNLLPPPEPESESGSDGPSEAGEMDENGEIRFGFADRRWRVRGLEVDENWNTLKANLRLDAGGRCHVDLVDLYSARHRAKYVKDAAAETGENESSVKSDVGRMLVRLEELREELAVRNEASQPNPVESMSEDERKEAMALLADPNLLDRIVADFRACGLVGEDANALFGYVAATSRKLDDPISVIIQSSSSAGKSSLMDAVTDFVPPEERMHVTAMTARSLYYVGRNALKHKTVSISESEGMGRAGYALKLLQSEKKLSIASTGRDSKTGRQSTQHYEVEGPIQTIVTTTAGEIDEELQNRSVVLTVGEGRDQTRAIQELQRRNQTLEGVLERRRRERIVQLHRNAQRLLKSVIVVNPLASRLDFASSRLRHRRDHVKYLNLIRAVTLLMQCQRRPMTIDSGGAELIYVESTEDDVAIANELMTSVLADSIDELAPQSRKLYRAIRELLRRESERDGVALSEARVTRKRIRETTKLKNTLLGDRLRQLIEHEYIFAERGPHGRKYYGLVFDGDCERPVVVLQMPQ